MNSEFLREKKKFLILFLFLGISAAFFEVGFVLLLKKMVHLFSKFSSGVPQNEWMVILLILLGCVIGRMIFQWIQTQKLLSQIFLWVSEKRIQLMDTLNDSSFPIYRKNYRSEFVTILDQDVSNLKSGLIGWFQSLFSMLQLILFFPLLLFFPLKFSLGAICLFLPVLIISLFRIKVLNQNSKSWLKEGPQVKNGIVLFSDQLEFITGNGDSKKNGKKFLSEWIDKELVEKSLFIKQLVNPFVMELIYFILLVGFVLIFAKWVPNQIEMELWIPFLILLLLMYRPIREWSRNQPLIIDGKNSWLHFKRWEKTINEYPANSLKTKEGGVLFENVFFNYELPQIGNEKYVLQNFNNIFPNQGVTLIRGQNGLGKSTLLKLIAGVEMPIEGNIIYPKTWTINNKLDITYLPQHTHLDFSIWNKIESAKIRDDELWHWLNNVLHLDLLMERWFIKKKWMQNLGINPENINQYMFPSSYQLETSGGEKQRLNLANVFLSNKKILLLDEPTTWLPGEDRFEIMQKLIWGKFDFNPSLKSIILVSHEPQISNLCDYVFDMEEMVSIQGDF